ncbi:MAG TPA: hypothetical protein VED40_00380 [Azospirillaceae bacterium]|nr:hypothetical protein [Azospirillaceae bacterium]
MPNQYKAKPLDARRIDQAFPVMQAAMPGLDIRSWRAFAAKLVGPRPARRPTAGDGNVVSLPVTRRSGIVTVQLGRGGYIHGLFTYQVVPHLGHGRVLQVDNFIALDLFDPAAAADTLMQEMEHLGRLLGCGAIHVLLRQPEEMGRSLMLRRFEELGHHREGLHLCKGIAH